MNATLRKHVSKYIKNESSVCLLIILQNVLYNKSSLLVYMTFILIIYIYSHPRSLLTLFTEILPRHKYNGHSVVSILDNELAGS